MAGRIRLLGAPAILGADGGSSAVPGHQAWALLARILLTPRPIARRPLAAELFPESADPLGSLRWCLAALRKALGSSECLTGDPIEAKLPQDITIDLRELEADALDLRQAGPLIAGIDPSCSPEFSTWLLVERARIAALIDGKLRRETLRALATADYALAVQFAELAVSREIFDEAAHVLLVKALALAGKHDAALQHVEATERLFIAELGEAPTSALRSAARRTVASPPVGVSAQAHVRSLILSGKAALTAGAADAGIDNLRRAVSDAEKSGDSALVAAASLELGKGLVHAVRGFDDEGAILLRQCVEISRASGAKGNACEALAELGYVEALAGRRPVAAQYLADASLLAETPGERAGVDAMAAFNLVDWGRVAEGLRLYARALEQARAAGDHRREIWCLGVGARGQLAAGQVDEAEAWLSACLDLVDRQHQVAFRPWPVALLAEVKLHRQAAPENLRPPLEEAFALSCQLRDPCWEAGVARSMALTYAAEGDLTAALRWFDDGYRRCIRESDVFVGLQVDLLANRAETLERLGEGEAAASLAREWVALAARAHMDRHVARAAAFLASAREL